MGATGRLAVSSSLAMLLWLGWTLQGAAQTDFLTWTNWMDAGIPGVQYRISCAENRFSDSGYSWYAQLRNGNPANLIIHWTIYKVYSSYRLPTKGKRIGPGEVHETAALDLGPYMSCASTEAVRLASEYSFEPIPGGPGYVPTQASPGPNKRPTKPTGSSTKLIDPGPINLTAQSEKDQREEALRKQREKAASEREATSKREAEAQRLRREADKERQEEAGREAAHREAERQRQIARGQQQEAARQRQAAEAQRSSERQRIYENALRQVQASQQSQAAINAAISALEEQMRQRRADEQRQETEREAEEAAAEEQRLADEQGQFNEPPSAVPSVSAPAGTHHSTWPHVIAQPTDGQWQPEPGYRWVYPNNASNLAVRWEPGRAFLYLGSVKWPHVVASPTEGLWLPESGYEWEHLDNKGRPIPGDLAVKRAR